MPNVRFAVIVILLLSTATAVGRASDSDKVLAAEAALDSAVAHHDVIAAGKLIAPDYTVTIARRAYDHASFLLFVGDRSVSYSVLQAHDESVRLYGDSTAIVVGILDVNCNSGTTNRSYRERFTDTWVKIGGFWIQVAAHLTNLP